MSGERKLLPAIVQDALNGRVLMLGWMDDEALALTRSTGQVHFWSRSRQRIWKKGETSGNVLALVEIKTDCDSDTWLVRAIPHGPTCHTGSISCFGSDGAEPAAHELDALEKTIASRKAQAPGTRSYVRSLLDQGAKKIAEKIREEANELAVEVENAQAERQRIISEAADVLFHTLVGLAARDVTLDDVLQELHRRAGTSGLDEKAARKK
jgi:phosphoribosyl-ATP pyrophosphohydrolase/phosphoribosyl-AMP cyclohydrolase